ncbi:phospholipase C, phosphocholine-specific [Methylocaldum marinum]|uniref:Phospholipase C, phosphocholine-specific n=2 Tax=Methylocaldum marinum TaxID=1432792 RepID=A0A250KLP3_9GAMM|nr:phospholipase C, phosphocholine-specific [Methylocaldum marinum]
MAGATAALSVMPPAIHKALAIPAHERTRSIKDVKHIVILMQENRSFDHYFGALRGVRGFGDRFPIPLASGKPVWFESDGSREITPYRLDKSTMNAALIPSTPHNFPDAQLAWNQGKFGYWAKAKTQYSMGYYTREEAPFQWALAEAFTICDNYFCSVQSGTDPNRIVFWSGSGFDPAQRAAGINCTDTNGEPVNLRCWIKGALPEPGYTYQGSAFNWATIPDVLEAAGISWRIYQNPNDNWTGAMHGCLAFESFRTAQPDSPLYKNGMTHWSLDDLRQHVLDDTLPEVSWVLPSRLQSEHPGGPSSPARGGDFTHQVLDALTANPEVWSKTVFFLTFDENDGLFDHVPPPAVPSYNIDGSLAGDSTIPLEGMYFHDVDNKYVRAEDTISGNLRPWGLGPRVPMYVVSPWSRGGWVSSQVFDHTSVGQFIEKRFGVTIPAITPWHRTVCGDLTSAFDFEHPNDRRFPQLPDTSNYEEIEAVSKTLPPPSAPATPQPLYQELGMRWSRSLPYELNVTGSVTDQGRINLHFSNSGKQGAVFHVYDKLHLDHIPRRYTVEAGKMLSDDFWDTYASDNGAYDLWVYGANGFVRSFAGLAVVPALVRPEAWLSYDAKHRKIKLTLRNAGTRPVEFTVNATAYRLDRVRNFVVPPGKILQRVFSLERTGNWYDLIVQAENFERRFAGRLETGKDTVSDPLMGHDSSPSTEASSAVSDPSHKASVIG